MKRFFLILIILSGIFLIGSNQAMAYQTGEIPPPPKDKDDVRRAIQEAINKQNEAILSYLLYDESIEQIRFAEDGLLARATLVTLDPERSQAIEHEPGLAFALWESEQWTAILPSDPNWLETMYMAPEKLIPEEEKNYWLALYRNYQNEMPTAAIGGYYLPWEGGTERYLTQSVGHDQYTSSGNLHFAFDFALNNTHWPIRAAKPGTVWMYKIDVPTCEQWTCNQEQKIGNYIVLKDETTEPTTYQLYLHLAFESIPSELRTVGAQVSQGQLIGTVDNTGQSWGSHLHFQVHTNPSHYFGKAIDITFEDVLINGGRPRVEKYDADWCLPSDICDSYQTYYTSGNIGTTDTLPPVGDIINIADGEIITASSLSIIGEASDIGDGVHNVQFIAFYNNTWHNIGAPISINPENPTYNWDWCASSGGIPITDGFVSVAMRITDKANNTTPFTGLRHVIKSYTCPSPPPACTPSDNQIALFSEANYIGNCQLFNTGSYTETSTLGMIGDNQATSLLVGNNVQATLFVDSALSQRGETFFEDDNNLLDNLIGTNTTSSLLVQPKTTIPAAPLPQPLSSGPSPSQGDIFTFGWNNGGGALQYQLIITGPTNITTDWLTMPYSHTSNLPTGSYTWHVHGRNTAGTGPWSSEETITITSASPISDAPLPLPFSDDMESGDENWTGAGIWTRTVADNHTESGSYSWWYRQTDGDYDNGQRNHGTLTSVPISITTSNGPYYLRFYYKAETESNYHHWDQRWLQISSDGGPFVNVWQFGDELANSWLQSPPINLETYAGHAIRLRFHFETLDSNFNSFAGWGIDDVSIDNTAPPCAPDSNVSPATAVTIAYGGSSPDNLTICPNGDVDFYKFTGNAGDEIGANVDARSLSPTSALDSVLTLIAPDGTSVLAENDDQVLELNRDSLIRFRLPESGTYYLKVRAWDHPNVGNTDYTYRIRLFQDATRPTVTVTSPLDNVYLPGENIVISADASDSGSGSSGVESVAFYWHDQDWENSAWEFIGMDYIGTDGWAITHTFSAPDQTGVALYALATDQAGNTSVDGAWNMTIDHTPPVSALQPVNSTTDSTALTMQWNGSDNISGMQYYNLQRQVNDAGWNEVFTYTAETQQAWLVGEADNIYTFRLRGLDNAGNTESYPASPEVTMVIPRAEILCSTPDMWEPDNSSIMATQINTSTLQLHNFCNSQASGYLNDADWLKLNVQTQKSYLLSIIPMDQSAAVEITLYNSLGVTITQRVSPGYGLPTMLDWSAPTSGINYIRLRHINGNVIGNGTQYVVKMGEGNRVYLPLIHR